MSNIVFTQDVKGESEYLNTHLGDYISVPYSENTTVKFSNKTYKSLYTNQIQNDKLLYDKNWHLASNLLTNVSFKSSKFINSNYQLFTFGRCASTFMEKELVNNGFTKLTDHYIQQDFKNNHISVVNECISQNKTIFLLYRKDWWDWVTSTSIGHHNSFVHYNNSNKLNTFQNFEITIDYLDMLDQQIKNIFNFWCNLRTVLNNSNMFISEFSDIVNNHNNEHKKIKYKKQSYITNYDSVQKLVYEKYIPKWDTYTKNIVKHLEQMKVVKLKDLDKIKPQLN